MNRTPEDPLATFHPTVAAWFRERLGPPSPVQSEGWPLLRSGRNALLAAPTGSGKTLAAFLVALDGLLRRGCELADETTILYISPLKALGNDVQKNLLSPLEELRERDPSLPEIRVSVRSGDTKQSERQAMIRKPPQVLVTTPESLYVLLTSQGGRSMLQTVRTVIVDEIHAVCANRRGAHLGLSLERLAALAGEFQRIGLSATQKPIEDVARFLVGAGRDCEIVDRGHLRELDLRVCLPSAELSAVASEDHWRDVTEQCITFVREHRTTLVFANTRKVAERLARRLSEVLGTDAVTSHHGSLSRERRLDAEQRLKNGELRALVATASLELGIDIGDVDLVVQVGVTASIAQLLQRVGRAGHGVGRIPKGRLFPLTQDELVTAAALMQSVDARELDALPPRDQPLDILAQQVVAASVARDWTLPELHAACARAAHFQSLDEQVFRDVVDLHLGGRHALLHLDLTTDTLRATKRARLPALSGGGAIPDTAEYEVRLEPEGIKVGTLDEDFAIESTTGDVFQLGNTSWRIVKIESGRVRVVDAEGAPPSMPFWFGEGPSRSSALTGSVQSIRRRSPGTPIPGFEEDARAALDAFLDSGREDLGVVPDGTQIVLERFFDESGGTQLVIHAPFGARVNRAFGLALRKKFCRGFGFELQAAANEDAIVLSLGPMHSFPLDDVFGYLHPDTAREVLTQAVLATPMFLTRWRWNVGRSLVRPRSSGGKRVPPQIQRMRADDALAEAFPEALACGENLPAGDLPVPMDHPLIRQTIEDCLEQQMDVEGLISLLSGLRDGTIERRVIDRPSPSRFAQAILNAAPYMFLDDAPLEERRTQAVRSRHAGTSDTELGALDPQAVLQVRDEAWPDPGDANELHEILSWIGFVTDEEARGSSWTSWVEELREAGRIETEGGRIFATGMPRDSVSLWRGRLEALGPVQAPLDDPALLALEGEGAILRIELDGKTHWCERRLLARIHRRTLDGLRRAIRPVSAADFLHFLARYQHAHEAARLDGAAGLSELIAQFSGLDAPARALESIFRSRMTNYRSDWLDQLTLGGEVVWLRLWGAGRGAVKSTPLAVLPRRDLLPWLAWRGVHDESALTASALTLLDALRSAGASFPTDLQAQARLLQSQFEEGLAELVSRGLATCDSFAALRALAVAPSKRGPNALSFGVGRVSAIPEVTIDPDPDFVLDRLLDRYGVVFYRLMERERIRLPWRDVLRCARQRELAGTLRGGRFVEGFSGEQYARAETIPQLRAARDRDEEPVLEVPAADPLNLRGILTHEARVAINSRTTVALYE
ncbi:MAG: DEAD/DEAH box helicase [Planctomycetota bacterium]